MGRATEGSDFIPLFGSVVFLANQSEANITLQVLDDEDPERDESVFVKLISVELITGEQERRSKIYYFFKILKPRETTTINCCLTFFSFQFPFFGHQD